MGVRKGLEMSLVDDMEASCLLRGTINYSEETVGERARERATGHSEDELVYHGDNETWEKGKLPSSSKVAIIVPVLNPRKANASFDEAVINIHLV